jgi:hypothetical protein
MLKNSTSRISSFRTSYSLGLSFILALLFVSMLFAQQANAKAELVIYSLTASAGTGGTISPSGTVFQGQGSSQTFTITPSSGYTIASVLVDGTSVGAVASYTFSDISANHTISATFAASTSYTITASAGANGTISPSGAVTVYSGASQTFSFTPATGYQVSSVLVDGAAVTAASSYTFSNVTAGHTISVTFAPITYTITASAGSNGTISPSGAVTVNYGASQAFSFTPATGYQVSSILVDGAAVTTASSYSFSNVIANHTISVSFAPITYTITASTGSNGTISPSGAVTVNYGASQAFSFTPATGYQVLSVLVDGAAVTAASSYTFSNVTGGHTISVTFAPITYTLTPSAGANGTISPSSAVTVNSGGSQAFSFTPATGYQVSSILVDGAAVTTASSYSFSNVTANHTISVTFAPITYAITASAGSNGTISPSGAVTVNYGGSQAFSFSPATGYKVSSVLVDGAAVTTASSYSFSSVTANHTISVSFAPITFTITASSGSNGTISPSGAVTVNYGASQAFSFTPATGYQVSSVLVDGAAVTTASGYTFSNVTVNHTISVSFAQTTKTYTITPSAGANGTISPSSAVTVNSGGSQTFSFTPATGYKVSGVLVDGTAVTTASSYTFSNVTANHTISVSFAPITFTITASSGSNGTVSPSGAVTVSYGASQAFSFTPATGYKVSSILVDGTAVTTASSYSFSNVTANHTISVSFAQATFTITASAGSNGTISPSGAVTVNYGASQAFSFTPATGYKVSSILVDGTAVTTGSSYSFSNVTSNHTISVSFAQATKTYTITPSAGSNGTISPSSAVTLNSGSSQTFTITPATGYQVSSVLIDGATVGSLTSYTFSNVTANHTISATFTSASTFTITPAAGTNGTISPATPVKVKSGASQAFTIVPATGFQVANVQVDGASVGALTTYTFSNVTANHTISASFATANDPLVADAGPDQTVAKRTKVTLNGSNSTNVGGPGIASYLWAQIGGTPVRLSNPSAAITTFCAPKQIGALTFQLTVTDVNGLQSTATCIVNVATACGEATLATANAGPDQTVNEGTMITLDGSNSTDPHNCALSYLWQQMDGPAVTLSNPNSPQPTFAAPQVRSGAVSLRFMLTVTNKYGLKSTDTCFVNVTLADTAPHAVAGPTETAIAGSVVTLDGSGSSDPGCGIASYIWHQTQGSPVTLSVPTSVTPAFTAMNVCDGHYYGGNQLTFMLIVEGTDGMRTRATQVIEVEKKSPHRCGSR